MTQWISDPISLICYAEKLPLPVCEFRFHPPRRWKFDRAWPDRMVCVEIEGGAWIGGRHTRGSGFLKDIEKYNTAIADGWRLFRTTPGTLPELRPFLIAALK